MARQKNYDEVIAKIDTKIEKQKQVLADLQEERKVALEEKEQSELRTLNEYIQKTGKSVSEFMAELNSAKESA